jgi:signal transduction histidine kinase
MRIRRSVGVRPRLVATLVLTSAITLAVAAFALLPPLENRLRADELDTLVVVAKSMRASFGRLEPEDVRPGSRELARLARLLSRRATARVTILDAAGRRLVGGDPDLPDAYTDARSAGARDRVVRGTGTLETGAASATSELRAAVPARAGGRRIVLALRRSSNDAPRAAQVVKRAVLPAALAALVIAATLGVAISTGMLRRLKRLHRTALTVAESGPSARVEADQGRDEIGDLARALATMQGRLQRQEDARRRFVSTASHELRTPLHSLQMMLELLDDGLEDDDTRVQVRRARDQTRRLSGLAASLLDLSRIDAGVPLRTEPVDVTEVCRAVVAEFGGPRARVELDLPEHGCWARADPGAVAQVLRILLDNAQRVTASEGVVSVSVGRPNGVAEVAVEDHGPGVAPAEQEAIFERFWRGSAREADGGFGLGLAIGRELATRMAGELVLTRTGPGARFVVRLPAETPPLG